MSIEKIIGVSITGFIIILGFGIHYFIHMWIHKKDVK
jgi:hypothetical protein